MDCTALAKHIGQHFHNQTKEVVLQIKRAARAVRVTPFVYQPLSQQRPPRVYRAALENTKKVLVMKPVWLVVQENQVAPVQ